MGTKKFKITQSAFDEIKATVGNKPAESGGLLFGSRKDYTVTRFLFDKNSINTQSSYTFNTGYLNPIIKKWWEEEGLELIGFLHSHPFGIGRLSEPDKKYFASQFKNIDVEKFLTPIIFSDKDGGFKFIPLVFNKDGTIDKLELEIISETKKTLKKKKNKSKKRIVKKIYKSNITVNITNTINKVKAPKSEAITKIDKSEFIKKSTVLSEFDFFSFYQALFAMTLVILLGFLILLIPSFYKYIIQQLIN